MRKTILTLVIFSITVLAADAQNSDELRPSRLSSESYIIQKGIEVDFNTLAIQVYLTVSTLPFKVGFYLSTDTLITPSDYLAGTYNVACMNNAMPACSATSSAEGIKVNCSIKNISLATLNIPPGTYYVGAYIDRDSVITEDDETNNGWAFRSAAGVKTPLSTSIGMGLFSYDLTNDIDRHYTNEGDYVIESMNGEEIFVEQFFTDGKLISSHKGLKVILPNGKNDLNILRIRNSQGTLNIKILL